MTRLLTICMALLLLAGCGKQGEITVTIFAAKSLEKVVNELVGNYEREHPGVLLECNYDSSGTLMNQIRETNGENCDLFFSAAGKQMDVLEKDGLLVEGSRRDVLKNRLCVVTYPGSGTAVTGLETLELAKNFALAGGSVPAGQYTRKALIGLGTLSGEKEADGYTSQEVSEALGGVAINECTNVGAVVIAVSEHANEVGTVYYSDLCGYAGKLEILQEVDTDLTGEIVYPLALIRNSKASREQRETAEDVYRYLSGSEAQDIYEKYCFGR